MEKGAVIDQDTKGGLAGWLGKITAVIVAVGALIAAVQYLWGLLTPAPPPIPTLAPTDVANIKGSGNTVVNECEPQRQAYAAQHPDFDISIDQNVQPSSTKDILGQVTYTFHCHFNATRKAK